MSLKPKIKSVAIDVDETLGNFSQFSIFAHAIEEYFDKPDITYRYFNDLVDLYPEIIRPSMLRILEYIRKKKNSIPGTKVMIYTNNMGPDKWVAHIRQYFEYKLRASAVATSGGLAIIPPLFDHTIGGFKERNAAGAASASASAFPQRTTKEKTVNELIRCARIPSDSEICFLDDVYHPKMADERVYYIKLQPYHCYIPFHIFVARFVNSALYRDVFAKFITPGGISPASAAEKQIIEINNIFVKYANMAKYDAKAHQRKMYPREIDEIISKYILYHLQQFFRDGPPPVAAAYSRKAAKTAKKNRSSSSSSSSSPGNVFYVDKVSAVKNIRNKTARKR